MKYNNIQDVSTTNLYKMLSLKQFQNKGSQKMIQDEIKFRNEPVTMQQMTNIFKYGVPENSSWLVYNYPIYMGQARQDKSSLIIL